MDGNLKEKEVYTIEKVELNPDIPDEVFEFRPPEGYDVADLRPGSGYDEKVKRESEALAQLQKLHEVSDIPELRKLLKHESWKVRLIALKTIGGLAKDRAVLRDIAASMQNDENSDVHKEADRILRRIESNK
jgi:HEAT repeat protein